MAWSTPRTWVVMEEVTAAEMNQNIRDNGNFLRTFHGSRMWQSAALSHTANGAYQLVTWDTLDYDTDSISSLSTEKFIVPTGFAGGWRFVAACQFAGSATGIRVVQLMKNETYSTRVSNGVGVVVSDSRQTPAANAMTLIVTWTGPLVATDTISLTAFQSSGGNLAFGIGQATMSFEAHYLGA